MTPLGVVFLFMLVNGGLKNINDVFYSTFTNVFIFLSRFLTFFNVFIFFSGTFFTSMVWIQYPCDGRTDGQTDRLAISSHNNIALCVYCVLTRDKNIKLNRSTSSVYSSTL